MSISTQEVEKIAKLVNLDLSDAEKEKLSSMFSDTLEKIEVLKELDTAKVSETYQVTGTVNVFSDINKNKQTLTSAEALYNAQDPQNGLFGTSAVFDRE